MSTRFCAESLSVSKPCIPSSPHPSSGSLSAFMAISQALLTWPKEEANQVAVGELYEIYILEQHFCLSAPRLDQLFINIKRAVRKLTVISYSFYGHNLSNLQTSLCHNRIILKDLAMQLVSQQLQHVSTFQQYPSHICRVFVEHLTFEQSQTQ